MFASRQRLFAVLCLLWAFRMQAAVLYVDINSTNPVPPFSTWATAATNIQDAVDASSPGDTVLVTDGIYQYGGRPSPGDSLTNRLTVTTAITIESVNGPSSTIIQGAQIPGPTNGPTAVRCVYLSGRTLLSGFTVTNGATEDLSGDFYGGGVYCTDTNEKIVNCVIAGNAAWAYGAGAYSGTFSNCTFIGNACFPSASSGGGAYGSTASHCLFMGNSAIIGGGVTECTLYNCSLISNFVYTNGGKFGGGASSSTLNNCLLSNNTALLVGGGAVSSTLNDCILIDNSAGYYGGGVQGGRLSNCTLAGNTATNSNGGAEAAFLTNCIIYYNYAPVSPDCDSSSTLQYCCTSVLPSSGIGNITNDPRFMNLAAGDLHLQSNSPCINSGTNAFVIGTNDFDGNPRISGGTVDMGAYEFQNPGSILPFVWLEQYGLATDGSADFADTDGDGMNNWQEYIAGTNPTNAASVLKMLLPNTTNATGVILSWQSVTNRTYFLQRVSNPLVISTPFQTIVSNLAGQSGITSYTDRVPFVRYFYRVGVQ